jgi:hypothetical protein
MPTFAAELQLSVIDYRSRSFNLSNRGQCHEQGEIGGAGQVL